MMASLTLVSADGNFEVVNAARVSEYLDRGYITVEAWQAAEKEKAEQLREAWLNSPDTLPERFRALRMGRDSRLAATDYLLASDYPLEAASREAVITYRQALRDLPAQPGAPWDGGGELTPWPVMGGNMGSADE